MTEPLKQFFKVLHETDGDDQLLSLPVVEQTLDKVEDFGKDLEQSIKGRNKTNISSKVPVKPLGATPTYAESAFIGPKKETTLYDVTNTENKVPTVEKQSKVSKNVRFNVHGLTFGATYAKKFGIFAGRKLGLALTDKSGSVKTKLQADYSVHSGKSTLTYSKSSNYESYSVSVFNRDDNNGVTAGYSRRDGFNSTFSMDENSASLRCGYEKKFSDCTVNLDGYATTGDNYSKPFAGVGARVTF